MQPSPAESAVFVDLGTTNTRVWLMRGDTILARRSTQVGVRDTARDGSNTRLRYALAELIASVIQDAGQHADFVSPRCVIAAGMITSSLGLAEVPHVPAPAGLAELATGARRFEFPDITPLPIILVPGIRSGTLGDRAAACEADVMRGEETLCIGLASMQRVALPGIVLNLGSHWKAIQMDADGRVAASVTSLAGELIHATQTGTILASAVPQERPASIDLNWLNAGMAEQRRSGLSRALFCVRLHEQSKNSTPQQRMAFLIGAFIACDLDAWIARGVLTPSLPVALVGSTALVEAWGVALNATQIPANAVTEAETETALLRGLRAILRQSSSLATAAPRL